MTNPVPVYVALGSNLQNPSHQLNSALHAIAGLDKTTLVRVSAFYRSSAVGPGNQPDYLNAVALLHTSLDAPALLHALQRIEDAQGRQRAERWGARTLDLDILLFGDAVIDTDELTVPHPRMHERDFVLYPLREISDTKTSLPDGSDLESLIARLPPSSLERTGEEHAVAHNARTPPDR